MNDQPFQLRDGNGAPPTMLTQGDRLCFNEATQRFHVLRGGESLYFAEHENAALAQLNFGTSMPDADPPLIKVAAEFLAKLQGFTAEQVEESVPLGAVFEFK